MNQAAKVIPLRRETFLTAYQEEIVELAFQIVRARFKNLHLTCRSSSTNMNSGASNHGTNGKHYLKHCKARMSAVCPYERSRTNLVSIDSPAVRRVKEFPYSPLIETAVENGLLAAHTMLSPQTMLKPCSVLSPQTRLEPQTIVSPKTRLLPQTIVSPHTRLLPQIGVPQITELVFTSVTVFVSALYCAIGDAAVDPTGTVSVEFRAAHTSRYPAPTVKMS